MSEMDTYLIRQLCHQILGGIERDPAKPTSGVQRAGSASINVEIQGMVHNIRRQIWIDHGAIAQAVTEEITRQAAEIDLGEQIRQVVATEISSTIYDLERIVRAEVSKIVQVELREKLGKFPQHLARRLAERMYDQAWDKTFKTEEEGT